MLQAINDTGGTPASATLSAVLRAAEADLRVPRGSLKAKTSEIVEIMKEVMQLKELPCVEASVRVRIIASPPRHRRDRVASTPSTRRLRDGCSPQDLNEPTALEEGAVRQAIHEADDSATLNDIWRAAEVTLRVPSGSLEAKKSEIVEVIEEGIDLEKVPRAKAPVKKTPRAAPPPQTSAALSSLGSRLNTEVNGLALALVRASPAEAQFLAHDLLVASREYDALQDAAGALRQSETSPERLKTARAPKVWLGVVL